MEQAALPTSPNNENFLKDAKRIRFALNATGIGIWELNVQTNVVVWDERCRELYGLNREASISLEEAMQAIHADDLPGVMQQLQAATQGADGGRLDVTYRVLIGDGRQVRWLNASGAAYFDETGAVVCFGGTVQDVSKQEQLRQTAVEEARRFQSLVENALTPICVFKGEDLVLDVANQPVLDVWQTDRSAMGKPLLEIVPELHDQPIIPWLLEVYHNGTTLNLTEIPIRLMRKAGEEETRYFNFVYQPYRETDGAIIGVTAIATDVTHQLTSRKKVEVSERLFRSLVEQAPVATCLFVGRELRIDVANVPMLEIWGKGDAVLGKPLAAALPELEGQPFLGILHEIFITGKPFAAQAAPCKLVVNGVVDTYYFDFTYKPIFNEAGEVYAIIDMAVDVTRQVLAQKKLQESEAGLSAAIELAELGRWSMDIASGVMLNSARLKDWLGEEGTALVNGAPASVHEDDKERVAAAVARAIQKNSNGRFDEIYTIRHAKTGVLRIIHALGQAIFDGDGNALQIAGTAQDITVQKDLQLALETEVQERTEELAATTEELQAINEELTESNEQLLHSNEELTQYAYVASHDLQEPLRKIQYFSGLLASRELTKEVQSETITRIASSTKRMSLLINDLLEFSRLLHSDALRRPVDLNQVVNDVVHDFELVILEKGAQVEVSNLPVIEGVGLQFNQLFTNLVGNALKFTEPGKIPILKISSRQASAKEVANHSLKPLPGIRYFHITVADNGIGFDPLYVNQIFEVFKRLHGRSEYSGSGIGLAICRRVVNNHQGIIFAEAELGGGASFHILLPEQFAVEQEMTLPENFKWVSPN